MNLKKIFLSAFSKRVAWKQKQKDKKHRKNRNLAIKYGCIIKKR